MDRLISLGSVKVYVKSIKLVSDAINIESVSIGLNMTGLIVAIYYDFPKPVFMEYAIIDIESIAISKENDDSYLLYIC